MSGGINHTVYPSPLRDLASAYADSLDGVTTIPLPIPPHILTLDAEFHILYGGFGPSTTGPVYRFY
jgi:hypothetical protein